MPTNGKMERSNACFYTTYTNGIWQTDITHKVQEAQRKLPQNIQYCFHND